MLRWIGLAIGVALLAWRLDDEMRGEIARGFAAMGTSGFLVVLALSLPRFATRAAAWVTLAATRLRFFRALGAFMAGEAAGNLTPFGLFVSEPMKVAYAAATGESTRTFSALTAETFFYGVSVIVYIIVGAAAMLEAFAVPDAVRMLGIAALAAMTILLAAAVWMVWRQPAVLSAMLARVPSARAQRLVERVRAFEVDTYGSLAGRRGRVPRVLAAHAAFHTLSFLEMWVTLYLITGESLALAALVLDAFGRVANIVFKMIPLQLGVHQVGSEGIAAAVGLAPEVGLTSSLVRTGRVIVWAIVGVALLGSMKTGGGSVPRVPTPEH